ncbi:MAG: hypothetical protein LBQ27_03790 [Clostridiales bacterium]|jgi:hypothetical protein|nr:hypothetical protein [Clostridiales bacterium]
MKKFGKFSIIIVSVMLLMILASCKRVKITNLTAEVITGQGFQFEYALNEELNLTGVALVVRADYSDGSSKNFSLPVTADMIVTANPTGVHTPSSTAVEVNYTFEGLTTRAYFLIRALDPNAICNLNIGFYSTDAKKNYLVGEPLDLTDISFEINIDYFDGRNEAFSVPATADMLTEAVSTATPALSRKVNFTFTYADITNNYSYYISVLNSLPSGYKEVRVGDAYLFWYPSSWTRTTSGGLYVYQSSEGSNFIVEKILLSNANKFENVTAQQYLDSILYQYSVSQINVLSSRAEKTSFLGYNAIEVELSINVMGVAMTQTAIYVYKPDAIYSFSFTHVSSELAATAQLDAIKDSIVL